jgi:uncharacterized membrane protein
MSSPTEDRPVTGWQRTLVVSIDRVVYSFSKHWLAVFNVVVLIYVGLPFLAPVLLNAGIQGPARVIYTMYSPLCHQMTQRSFFLFGEQPAYPREIAGTDYKPLEAYMGDLPEFNDVSAENWPAFFAAARSFKGNDQMGYKMALCERDIGIYGFVLVGGLVFAMLRNRVKIRALPFVLFVIIGMGPIAIDGFSQLISYWISPVSGAEATGIVATIQNVLPLRESTPMMRAFTGALFGFMLVWMTYPHVDAGMKGTTKSLGEKLRKAGALKE